MFIFLKKIITKFHSDVRGSILLFVMIFGFISFTLIVVGVSGYVVSENFASGYKHNRESAFQIADAGINYYRWHLAHNKNDFKDGTGAAGPYVHAYQDKNGDVIGHFSLNITAPATGTTVVVIESTGWLDVQPGSRRTIRARVGFPALTDYAFLTNGDVWIANDEVVHGKFHANGGIRFDGTGDSMITSATSSYTCKEFHGCGNQTKPGIWGDGGPQSYWQFPVPAKEFTAVTAKLSEIQTNADPLKGGITLSSSGKQGWRLSFQADGTIKIYKVNTTDCVKGKDVGSNKYVWYCIDIASVGTPTTYNMPTNGYIYVDDMVWVDGVVKGRAVVGTSAGKSIIINGNLTYTAKDGTDVIGLIAEQNILIPYNSPDDLEIDAAMLAQNGAAKRYYYPSDKKDTLIIYGSVISNGIWTWSWTSGGSVVVSGYVHTNSTYDTNLTYMPPPSFPVGSEYNLISWEEVK